MYILMYHEKISLVPFSLHSIHQLGIISAGKMPPVEIDSQHSAFLEIRAREIGTQVVETSCRTMPCNPDNRIVLVLATPVSAGSSPSRELKNTSEG
jgi:hypothetical protein